MKKNKKGPTKWTNPTHLWQRTAGKNNLDFLTDTLLFKGQYKTFCQILETSHLFTIYLDNTKEN